ncbi:SgcJ/EcaC family oxidoreductase [Quisquiliibacterium transsilvanicum]|uniref:Limonene-1,2-epoxide hydrolase n=1 Tax=Quisquiliibacterium transsilvanicum TaxID=1549638 RepID=A0A7W8HGK0_9BURK|nr:SgcJ/EcaC family oxidoreductase [Quisquiliibacterium transsilvanicum]MBB5271697.1 limonene-1,2-epoxide hydrolase [Quisquiliibacterium transsilvanicum]
MNDNERIIMDFIAAWSRLDADEIVSYFADDGVYHNMPSRPVQGREQIRAFVAGFLKPWTSTQLDMLNIISRGDLVIAERLDRTTAGERKLDLPCCGVFEMTDGKTKAWRDYFDMPTYTRAMTG